MALERQWMVVMWAVVALVFAGCASSSSVPPLAAVTEWDFSMDSTLRLQPGQVGITFLEAMDASANGLPDTGLSGTDVIPVRIDEPASYTYALDPEDQSGTIGSVEFRRPDDSVVFRLLPGVSPSVSVTLEPGNYQLFLFSGRSVAQPGGESSATVFLRPDPAAATAPVQAGGPAPRVNTAQLKRLLSSNVCVRCDLTGAALSGANLEGAILNSVNLSQAKLQKTKLSHAMLANAKLASADLTDASLSMAVLTGADLTGARLIGAFLGGARLSGATLTGADLSGAIWTDGKTKCAEGSIGECK